MSFKKYFLPGAAILVLALILSVAAYVTVFAAPNDCDCAGCVPCDECDKCICDEDLCDCDPTCDCDLCECPVPCDCVGCEPCNECGKCICDEDLCDCDPSCDCDLCECPVPCDCVGCEPCDECGKCICDEDLCDCDPACDCDLCDCPVPCDCLGCEPCDECGKCICNEALCDCDPACDCDLCDCPDEVCECELCAVCGGCIEDECCDCEDCEPCTCEEVGKGPGTIRAVLDEDETVDNTDITLTVTGEVSYIANVFPTFIIELYEDAFDGDKPLGQFTYLKFTDFVKMLLDAGADDEETIYIVVEWTPPLIVGGSSMMIPFYVDENDPDPFGILLVDGQSNVEIKVYLTEAAALTRDDNEKVLILTLNSNITVGDELYTLEVIEGQGGTVTGSASGEYKEGADISVTAVKSDGYTFVDWDIDGVTLPSKTVETLTFKMPNNNVTLTANFAPTGGGSTGSGGGGGSSGATLSPNKADFDKNDAKDITITLTPNGQTLKAIKNGAYTLKEGTDYTKNGNTVVIKASYLETLSTGTQKLVFEMSGGTNPTFTITVKDSSEEKETEPGYKPMAPLHPAGTKVEATKTNNILILNEKETEFPAVKIGGYNWIKLRDFAMLLNGTAKNFSVSYDETTRIVDIRTGSSYSPLGDELTDKLSPTENATATTQRLRVNGTFVDVAAYNIKGYNYLRVRDLAIILNFAVKYDDDNSQITLDLENPYDGE